MIRLGLTTILIFCSVVATSSSAAPQKKTETVTATTAFPEGEEILYTRVLENYRKGNVEEMQKLSNRLVKLFPRSVYNDNALYLTGVAFMEQNQFGPAIKLFDRVEEQYPLGNKRASAIYAKSVIYKKLNLPQLSQMMLQSLVKTYPGTAEGLRAKLELK